MRSPLRLRRSLRIRLIVLMTVCMIAVIGLGAYSIAQYSRGIQPVAAVLVKTIAQERATEITALLSDTSGLVRQLSSNPDVVNSLTSTNHDTAERAFQAMVDTHPNIKSVRFYSTDAALQVTVAGPAGDTASTPDFLWAVGNQNQLSQVNVGAILKDRVDFADIVLKGGAKVGYLVVSLDPQKAADTAGSGLNINNIFKSVDYPTGTLTFYFAYSDGTIEAPGQDIVTGNDALKQTAITLAAAAATATQDYVSPLSGVHVTGFSVPLPGFSRTLVVETQNVQVIGSDNAGVLTLPVLVVGSLSTLVILLVGVLLYSTVVKPIIVLSDVARRAAQTGGALQIDPITQRDEIGDLYEAFNSIGSRLNFDNKTLDIQIQERTHDLQAVHDIGQVIFAVRDLGVLLQQADKLLLAKFPFLYHAQIYLLDVTGQYLELRAASGEEGAELLNKGHRLPIIGESLAARAFQSAISAISRGSTTTNSSESGLMKLRSILPRTQTQLALPLRSIEGSLGVLDLHSMKADAFTESEIKLFQSIADTLGIAVSNAMGFERSAQLLHETEDLNRRMLGETWRDYARSRRHRAPLGSTSPIIEPWSDLQREAVETQDIVEHQGTDFITFAVPVMLRGQVLGAVEWDIPRSAYTENVRLLARELAGRLAISADNARLFEQAERVAQRERLVNEISSKLIQQTDVTEILQVAVREVGQALRVPQTMIRLATRQDNDSGPKE